MDDLGHVWTPFYVCAVCGIPQHEAMMGGIRCTAVEQIEFDPPFFVVESEDST